MKKVYHRRNNEIRTTLKERHYSSIRLVTPTLFFKNLLDYHFNLEVEFLDETKDFQCKIKINQDKAIQFTFKNPNQMKKMIEKTNKSKLIKEYGESSWI